MDKYYVSGCKGQDDDIVTCGDDEAQFWTLYKRFSDGTRQGVIDCTFREDAEAAMRVYVERDALLLKVEEPEALLYAMRIDVRESREKMEAMLGESVARGEIIERLIGQYSCAGYHAVQNSNNPAQSLLYDAMQVQKPGATSAIANELRAEGVEMFAKESEGLRKLHFEKGDREMAINADSRAMMASTFADQLRSIDTKGATND